MDSRIIMKSTNFQAPQKLPYVHAVLLCICRNCIVVSHIVVALANHFSVCLLTLLYTMLMFTICAYTYSMYLIIPQEFDDHTVTWFYIWQADEMVGCEMMCWHTKNLLCFILVVQCYYVQCYQCI